MTNLVDAYQGNNINEFEKILKNNRCVCDKTRASHVTLPCLAVHAQVVCVCRAARHAEY